MAFAVSAVSGRVVSLLMSSFNGFWLCGVSACPAIFRRVAAFSGGCVLALGSPIPTCTGGAVGGFFFGGLLAVHGSKSRFFVHL